MVKAMNAQRKAVANSEVAGKVVVVVVVAVTMV